MAMTGQEALERCIQCSKRAIEIGQFYSVDDEGYLLETRDGSPTRVMVTQGSKNRPVKMAKPGMKIGDFWTLNLFREICGVDPAKFWFINSRLAIFAECFRKLCKRVVTNVIESNDKDSELFDLMSSLKGQVDNKTLTEIDLIEGKDLISFYYQGVPRKQADGTMSPGRTGQFQCRFFDKLEEEPYSKIRKKTIPVMEQLYQMFMGSHQLEDLYTYSASIIAMPEIEVFLNCMIGLARTMGPYVKKFFDRDFYEDELTAFIPEFSAYPKVMEVYGCSVVFEKPKEVEAPAKAEARPERVRDIHPALEEREVRRRPPPRYEDEDDAPRGSYWDRELGSDEDDRYERSRRRDRREYYDDRAPRRRVRLATEMGREAKYNEDFYKRYGYYPDEADDYERRRYDRAPRHSMRRRDDYDDRYDRDYDRRDDRRPVRAPVYREDREAEPRSKAEADAVYMSPRP